jgi:hypothetical protein
VARLNRLEAAGLAAALLLIALARHYGYVPFPPEMRGMVSKGLGGVAILALLSAVASMWRHRLVWLACAYWAFEELQVVLCSAAYIVEPWSVAPGQSICSAKAGFDLGAVGIMLAAVVLLRITTAREAG